MKTINIFYAGISIVLSACQLTTSKNQMKPPIAQKIPVTLTAAEHKRVDNYFWLNERDNPQVIAYLEAENAYTKAVMSDTKDFQERLYTEITSRIKQDDRSVPYFKNGYFYYSRYEQGGEYPIYCRRKGSMDAPEVVMLNGNEMAQGHTYFHIGGHEVSPDNRMLAYCVDTVGRRIYTTMFKDLQTGASAGAIISGTTGSLAWADDNQTLFYTLKNPETLRSEKMMAHVLSGNQPDRLIHDEKDEAFDIDVYRSKSEQMIIMLAQSNTSTEYRFLDVANPESVLRIVQTRKKDLEYQLAHYQNKFYIVTNYHAKNFRLMETTVEKPSKENWKEVIPHRDDVLLEEIEVFKDFIAVAERKNGLMQLRIRPMNGEEHYLNFGEEVYTAGISYNPAFDTDQLRFTYSSLTTPNSTFDYNMRTREKTLLKQQEIVGGFNPDEYMAKRLYAPAQDGKNIPVSLVYRKDTELNGKTPLLLYGYGSYGYTTDPTFSVARISLLDRGFVYAIAHIRGGQTLGREWYDDGKLLNKRNTFTDFIACAEYLIAEKYTDTEHLCAMGGSAGGLLMGAVVNMRPDLFKAVIAAVPFVDVVTTMSDKTIPLTTGEYDEWGNPDDETYYRYIMSYSPYDNVSAQAYPNMLVTTGLHDSQVQYWEPAKWVAKLRELKTGDNLLLLHTNMDAGHGGASGRFEQYRETALEYAFLCKMVGK
jgi:oligopeptidase B